MRHDQIAEYLHRLVCKFAGTADSNILDSIEEVLKSDNRSFLYETSVNKFTHLYDAFHFIHCDKASLAARGISEEDAALEIFNVFIKNTSPQEMLFFFNTPDFHNNSLPDLVLYNAWPRVLKKMLEVIDALPFDDYELGKLLYQRNMNGFSCLHRAFASDDLEIAKMYVAFLRKHSHVLTINGWYELLTQQTHEGFTLFHDGVGRGHPEMAKLLFDLFELALTADPAILDLNELEKVIFKQTNKQFNVVGIIAEKGGTEVLNLFINFLKKHFSEAKAESILIKLVNSKNGFGKFSKFKKGGDTHPINILLAGYRKMSHFEDNSIFSPGKRLLGPAPNETGKKARLTL